MKFFAAVLFLLITAPISANAYIGPGLTVALASYFTWPIAVIAGLLSIVVFYPLRFLWRRVFKRKKKDG